MPELTGRELDLAVAREVMGLTVTQGNSIDWIATHPMNMASCVVPPYSALRDWSHRVENEIERRGLVDQYIRHLAHILGRVSLLPPVLLATPEDIFRFRCVTPEQVCRAALAAVRGSGNDAAHQLP